MDTAQILDDLKAERERIDEAIAALQGSSIRRRGRPRSSPARIFKPRRRMSAAAKKKISEANKKRWAAWRKKNS